MISFGKILDSKGVSFVEFSLALPIFIGFLLSIMDVSYLVSEQSQINYVAKTVVRKAVVGAQDCTIEAKEQFQERLKAYNVNTTSVKACYEVVNAPNSGLYTGPFSEYTYLRLDVEAELNCFLCDVSFGLADNLKSFNKSYYQVLDSIDHACYIKEDECE